MASLLAPYTLKSVTLRNRIVSSPMCQYQARNGLLNEWHQTHYEALAKGGAGLVMVELTAVSPRGRITPGDTGLWCDSQVQGFAEVAYRIKALGSVPGIQIGHAGRKAGRSAPWLGGAPLPESDPNAWHPIAPSAIPYIAGSPHLPSAMTLEEIQRTQQDFAHTAARALEAGFEWLELHFAHGFLCQTFLSRQANIRTDRYGGSLENRARFLIDTVLAVKQVWPEHLPLTVRFGVVEFGQEAETSFSESIQVLGWLKEAGVDFIDVSLVLSDVNEPVPWAANFMVPYAERVRASIGLPVGASWWITDALQADAFVRAEHLDLIFFGRTLLANPHWPFQAALDLGIADACSVLPIPYSYWLQNWTH